MYRKFVGNGGGASILHFKFSPASVQPGIRGYPRIRDIPGYRVLPDCLCDEHVHIYSIASYDYAAIINCM